MDPTEVYNTMLKLHNALAPFSRFYVRETKEGLPVFHLMPADGGGYESDGVVRIKVFPPVGGKSRFEFVEEQD